MNLPHSHACYFWSKYSQKIARQRKKTGLFGRVFKDRFSEMRQGLVFQKKKKNAVLKIYSAIELCDISDEVGTVLRRHCR